MQVQQIIQASADVLTITRLTPGDVYKRVDDGGYSGDPVLRYGVVQSVMNNGTDSAVTALEYVPDYTDGVKAGVKVFNGAKPAAIFPATPDEVRVHLQELTESVERAVKEAEKTLATKRAALAAVERLAGDLARGNLATPETATAVLDA